MPNFPFLAANLTKYLAYGPCRVRRIHGYNAQAATVWIQLHEAPATGLTNGAVPNVKSFETTAANGFDYEFVNPIELNECTVALSTTETSYTAVGASGGLDMTVELDSNYLAVGFPPSIATTAVVAGDLVTTVNNLSVWTEAQGAAPVANAVGRLLRVDVIEQLGAARFIIILPYNSINQVNSLGIPLGQVIPPGSWSPLPANGTVNMFFGRRGLVPYAKDSSGEHKACNIYVVDNTSFGLTANSAVIRAIFSSISV